MSIFNDPLQPKAFNLLNPTSSTNNLNLLQQVDAIREQNALDTQAQQQRIQEEKTKQRRNPREGFVNFLDLLSDTGLRLQGQDPATFKAAQEKLLRDAENEKLKEEYISSLPPPFQMMLRVYGPDAAFKAQYGTDKAKPTSYQEYALTDDTPTREEYTQFLQSKRSSVSDPLRTITMGGKVVENVRDSELTPEFIKEINESGQVVQPLGFTEKFESSKDVDFAPIKSKYLATQNIIIKTSELAEKFATEPSSALAVGKATQFVDGIIKNIDAGGEILSKAKDTKVYKYIQNTSTSLEGKDFTSKIADASKASGVAESRIRDLAYLFAAARGQTGRGLSDKDYENALKIVTGGVGASGRIAVLEDVATGLRDEFYRDIDFDIGTSENEAYVNKLKGLPQLPSFINPFTQVQPQSNNNQNDDVPRIRIDL